MGDQTSKLRNGRYDDGDAETTSTLTGAERQAELQLLQQKCVPRPLQQGYEGFLPVGAAEGAAQMIPAFNSVVARPSYNINGAASREEASALAAPAAAAGPIPDIYETAKALEIAKVTQASLPHTIAQAQQYRGAATPGKGPNQVERASSRALSRVDSFGYPGSQQSSLHGARPKTAQAAAAAPQMSGAGAPLSPRRSASTSYAMKATRSASSKQPGMTTGLPAENMRKDVMSQSQRPMRSTSAMPSRPALTRAQRAQSTGIPRPGTVGDVDVLTLTQMPSRTPTAVPAQGQVMSRSHVEPIDPLMVSRQHSRAAAIHNQTPGCSVVQRSGSWCPAPSYPQAESYIPSATTSFAPPVGFMYEASPGASSPPPTTLLAGDDGPQSSLVALMPRSEAWKGMAKTPGGRSLRAPVNGMQRTDSMYANGAQQVDHMSGSFKPYPRTESVQRTRGDIDTLAATMPRSESVRRARSQVDTLVTPRQLSQYALVPAFNASGALTGITQAAPYVPEGISTMPAAPTLPASLHGISQGSSLQASWRPEGISTSVGSFTAPLACTPARMSSLSASLGAAQGVSAGSLRAPSRANDYAGQVSSAQMGRTPSPVKPRVAQTSSSTAVEQYVGSAATRNNGQRVNPVTPRTKYDGSPSRSQDVYERLQESQRQLLKLRDAQKQALARCAAQCNSLMMAAEGGATPADGKIHLKCQDVLVESLQ